MILTPEMLFLLDIGGLAVLKMVNFMQMIPVLVKMLLIVIFNLIILKN